MKHEETYHFIDGVRHEGTHVSCVRCDRIREALGMSPPRKSAFDAALESLFFAFGTELFKLLITDAAKKNPEVADAVEAGSAAILAASKCEGYVAQKVKSARPAAGGKKGDGFDQENCANCHVPRPFHLLVGKNA